MRIETERLILRTPSEDMIPLICDYYQRNRSFLEPWQPMRDEKFFTSKKQAAILSDDLLIEELGEGLRFWILPAEENLIIGQIGFSQIIRGIFLSAYLGYSLDGGRTGRGYMTEALEAAVSHVFRSLKLHRIEANVMPRNGASLRILEKLGFKNEGLAEKYLKINGVWEDHIHMTLLNDDPEI